MTFFVKATKAVPAKTKDALTISRLYAGILAVLVLMQMISFDRFLTLFNSFWLPGDEMVAYFTASFLVLAEVLAIPFLLRVRMSPAARVASMAMGWIVAGLWLFIALWLQLTINEVSNVGLLGAAVQLAPGWWAVCVGVAFGILAVWSSWGLWPFSKTRK